LTPEFNRDGQCSGASDLVTGSSVKHPIALRMILLLDRRWTIWTVVGLSSSLAVLLAPP